MSPINASMYVCWELGRNVVGANTFCCIFLGGGWGYNLLDTMKKLGEGDELIW